MLNLNSKSLYSIAISAIIFAVFFVPTQASADVSVERILQEIQQKIYEIQAKIEIIRAEIAAGSSGVGAVGEETKTGDIKQEKEKLNKAEKKNLTIRLP